MSLVPLLFSDALDDLMHLRRGSFYDQNIGIGMLNDDLIHPRSITVPLLTGYVRPWRHKTTRHSGVSKIQNKKDGFKVKMVDDCVVVEGKHEERQDEDGFISRQFQRRYRLPEDVDLDSVSSKLSSDGVLTIEAPKKALPPPAKERVLNITHTNAPALTEKSAGGGEKMEQ